MTKEEAIKILTGYMGGKIDPESAELYHAIELAVDILESQPSLPSNIDEAAQKVEDYYDVGEEHGYLCCHRGDIKGAVKFGAELMAGQFQKIEGKLVDWYETKGIDYCSGIRTEDSFEVPAGFYIKKKI